METLEDRIKENNKLLEHAMDFYKSFGREEMEGVKLGNNFWEHLEKSIF